MIGQYQSIYLMELNDGDFVILALMAWTVQPFGWMDGHSSKWPSKRKKQLLQN